MSKNARRIEKEVAKKASTVKTGSTSSAIPFSSKIKEALTGVKDPEKLREEAKQCSEKAKKLREEAKQCSEKAKKLNSEAEALEKEQRETKDAVEKEKKKVKEALEKNQVQRLFFTHKNDGTIDFDCPFPSEEDAKDFDDNPVSRRCLVVDGHYVRPLTKQEASSYHSS